MKKLLLAFAFIAGFSSLASAQSLRQAKKATQTTAAAPAAGTPRFANAKGETEPAVETVATPAKIVVTPKPATKTTAKPAAKGKKG